jgi:HSP20 family protein
MANESTSRQQHGERAQGGSSTGQQGAGAAQGSQGSVQAGGPQARGGQGGGESGQGQSGIGQSGTASSGQSSTGRAGGSGAMSTSRGDWRGGTSGRYGMSANRSGGDVGQYLGNVASSPFAMMRRISEEMDRLFDSFGMGRNFFPEEMGTGRSGAQPLASLWQPHLEMREHDGRLLVQMDLPGVNRDDVQVTVEPDAIVIQGQRTQQSEGNRQGVYHSERRYGSFYRTVPLPEGIDIDQATATFRDGVLEIELPMPQQARRGRQLDVRDGRHESATLGSQPAGTTTNPARSGQGAGTTSGSSSQGADAGGGSGATSIGGQHGSSGTP